MQHGQLSAGAATRDVTPEPGSLIATFPVGKERIPRRAVGAYDPIFIRAIVLDDGSAPVAIVGCDFVLINASYTVRIRAAVHERCPALAPGNLHIACSHTHSGPETTFQFGNTEDDPWLAEMVTAMVDAICEAYEGRAPARLGVGAGEAPYNFNRRVIVDGKATLSGSRPQGVPLGPVDHELGVVRIDHLDGRPLGVLVNWAAHALVLGNQNRRYSADWPGAMTRQLQRELGDGCQVVLLNGFAGNLHPEIALVNDYAVVEEIGGKLGARVLEIRRSIVAEQDAVQIQVRRETLQFQNRVDPSLTEAVEIAAVSFDDTVLGFFPGEMFVEFQLQLKQTSPFGHTFTTSFANDSIGYLPTRDAYRFGGYGVDICTWDPSPRLNRTRIPPGGGEAITARARELFAAMHGAS